MSARRIRLAGTFGRPGYADLFIDQIRFTLSNADVLALADDLARLLEAWTKEKHSEQN